MINLILPASLIMILYLAYISWRLGKKINQLIQVTIRQDKEIQKLKKFIDLLKPDPDPFFKE